VATFRFWNAVFLLDRAMTERIDKWDHYRLLTINKFRTKLYAQLVKYITMNSSG
jgi:hypothetical protein